MDQLDVPYMTDLDVRISLPLLAITAGSAIMAIFKVFRNLCISSTALITPAFTYFELGRMD